MKKTAEYIKKMLRDKGITQHDFSLKIGMAYQNISSALKGKRELPIPATIKMDDALSLERGTIATMQLKEKIEEISRNIPIMDEKQQKKDILVKIKDNGGLWSYAYIPENMADDDIIEESLRHLDFEDMHLIFDLWGRRKVKKVWNERLVPEGKRLNVLNTLLGIIFFKIENINEYLKRYGHYKNQQ